MNNPCQVFQDTIARLEKKREALLIKIDNAGNPIEASRLRQQWKFLGQQISATRRQLENCEKMQLPDLIPIGFQFHNDISISSQQYTVTLTIKNVGKKASSGSFKIMVSVDVPIEPSHVFAVIELPENTTIQPGQEISMIVLKEFSAIEFSPLLSDYIFSAWIDYGKSIDESNEGNNLFQLSKKFLPPVFQ